MKPGEDARLQSRGTKQSGVRLYNERLVLSLIRLHGQLPKAEIARLTGLSAQTVSVIVRQLEADDLVVRGASVKGKVGQPLQPFRLNADGAFSIGLKVGRRSGELLLLGLDGKVRDSIHTTYDFPEPRDFAAFAARGIAQFRQNLGPKLAQRISGLGIAAPFEIWKWEEEVGAAHDTMQAWKDFDLAAEISELGNWPVIRCNDATAACAAELFFGKGRALPSYAYIYIGYFAGGGIVIDGRLYQGPNGNAGAIGSIPVPGESGGAEQLIRSASLYLFEHALRDAGRNPAILWSPSGDWNDTGPILDHWIAKAARGLAYACASLASTLDCNAILIDGAMPAHVRVRLVRATEKALMRVNLDGISPFTVEEGSVGITARALGAASLPIFANFMTDRDVLFREVQ